MEKTLKEILKILQSIDDKLKKIERKLGAKDLTILLDEKELTFRPEISE